MHILLIGGTGTIGREVAARLAAHGVSHQVMTRTRETAAALGQRGIVGNLNEPETAARHAHGSGSNTRS